MDSPLDRQTRIVVTLLFAVTIIATPALFVRDLVASRGLSDFVAFRSFATFVAQHRAALIYRPGSLAPYQPHLQGVYFPYLYHPAMLLVVRPLAWMPPVVGRVAWGVVGVVCFAASLSRCSLGRVGLLLALVAPSTAVTVLVGQNTLLIASLLIGGLLLLDERPFLGGALLGLAVLKPQFCPLIPVALIAAGRLRPIAGAIAGGTALLVASLSVDGLSSWLAWWHAMPGFTRHLLSTLPGRLVNLPTVYSALMQLGVGAHTAMLGQTMAALIVASIIAVRFRGGAKQGWGPEQLAATLLAGSLLVTPYAYWYDLPILTGAVILATGDRLRAGVGFRPFELLLVVACLAFPFYRSAVVPLPIGPLLIATFLLTLGPGASLKRPGRWLTVSQTA